MMKRTKRMLIPFLTLIVLVCMMQLSVGASDGGVKMTGFTDTTVTISWPQQSETYEGRTLRGFYLRNRNNSLIKQVAGATATETTIKGQSKGLSATVWVYAVYSDGSSVVEKYVGYTYANTTPADVTGIKFGGTTTKIRMKATRPSKASGLQVETYDLKAKKATYQKFTSIVTLPTSKDTPYRVRVRAYYKNSSTGKTYFGKWSSYSYCDYSTVKLSTTSTKKGVDLTVKKCLGVDHFDFYVSTESTGGFEKTASVRVTGTSKTVHISKIGTVDMKQNTVYYVKVVPVFKIAGKEVVSKVTVSGKMLNMK